MVFLHEKAQIIRKIELERGFRPGLDRFAIGIILERGIYILQVVPNVRACQVDRFPSAISKVEGVGSRRAAVVRRCGRVAQSFERPLQHSVSTHLVPLEIAEGFPPTLRAKR